MLLLVTNPIDAQGFCSTEAKHALVRRFVDEIEGLLLSGDAHLVIKIHAGESASAYRGAIASSPAASIISIEGEALLETLFPLASAAVVLASTVGLEALLLGKRILMINFTGGADVVPLRRGAA